MPPRRARLCIARQRKGAGDDPVALTPPLAAQRCGPPTAEALLYGIIQLQNKIKRTNTIAR